MLRVECLPQCTCPVDTCLCVGQTGFGSFTPNALIHIEMCKRSLLFLAFDWFWFFSRCERERDRTRPIFNRNGATVKRWYNFCFVFFLLTNNSNIENPKPADLIMTKRLNVCAHLCVWVFALQTMSPILFSAYRPLRPFVGFHLNRRHNLNIIFFSSFFLPFSFSFFFLSEIIHVSIRHRGS